eukprot:c52149_g1_i1.p1 GENE.c52149_g1_i1~~c52149_g1_i1.p1  ORF type:complete len:325 (-),score=48.53 c52149_g1_i1:114-956(-)
MIAAKREQALKRKQEAMIERDAKRARVEAPPAPPRPVESKPNSGWNSESTTFSLDELGPSWAAALESQERALAPMWKSLKHLFDSDLARGAVIYPPRQDVFAAFRLCPLENVKVVIVGQDPYHGGQAEGLAFSVRRNVPIPPSLVNIIKEAKSCVGIRTPRHGSLIRWASQGVLLLNTVLTVRQGEPNSHKTVWEPLTGAVLKLLSREKRNLVFMLWGSPAQKVCQDAVSTQRHLAICSSHPSPLGATKTASPFLGSRCFAKANEYLTTHGLDAVDWNLD